MTQILLTTTGTGSNPLIFPDLGSFTIGHPTVNFPISTYNSIDEINNSIDLQTALDNGWVTLQDDNSTPITGTISNSITYVLQIEKNDPKWNANEILNVPINDTNIGATSSQVLSYNSSSGEIEYQTLNYIHYQPSSSNTWNIIHNLNRFPSVTIVDSGNNVIEGCVSYINQNEVQLEFNSSFGGKAYLT